MMERGANVAVCVEPEPAPAVNNSESASSDATPTLRQVEARPRSTSGFGGDRRLR